MGRDSLKLGPLEMEVLGFLEGAAPLSVHDLQERLNTKKRTLAYTTVMTVLTRLYDKGLLVREKCGRQYLYSPAKKAQTLSRGVWSTVYRALFQNDRLKPILSLIDQADNLTAEELTELKKFVDRKIKERKRS